MFDVKRLLGFIWAAPLTAIGLSYVLSLSIFGWYKFIGFRDDALVWVTTERTPSLLSMIKYSGRTIGNVVVIKYNPDTTEGRTTLKHEQQHVRHYMRLGPFMPLLYSVSWMSIKLACSNSDPHYSNVFEVDARRAAGQIIDVEGTVRRLKAHAQKRETHT